jgi:hypothetical protein
MKKFLWFLVGMAVIISIPIMLFSGRTPPEKTPEKGIEIRRDQAPKPGPVSDMNPPVHGAALPGKATMDKKQNMGNAATVKEMPTKRVSEK